MKAQMCRFRRTAESKWEVGIMIGTEADETALIVDEDGKTIAHEHNVHDFHLTPERGCFESYIILGLDTRQSLQKRAYEDGIREGTARALKVVSALTKQEP